MKDMIFSAFPFDFEVKANNHFPSLKIFQNKFQTCVPYWSKITTSTLVTLPAALTLPIEGPVAIENLRHIGIFGVIVFIQKTVHKNHQENTELTYSNNYDEEVK